jgi:hypothetical protein
VSACTGRVNRFSVGQRRDYVACGSHVALHAADHRIRFG